MIRLAVGALVLTAVAAAPTASADPQDLVPGCTSGQVADPGECAPQPEEAVVGGALEALGGIPGAFPGANPNIPPTVLPLNFPMVLPLGPVPLHQPQNLPLGPTPPAVLPVAN